MTIVKKENTTRTKNVIKGYFLLSDNSKTQFRIDKEYGWQQWGNVRENLCITINRVEQLQNELYEF
jgi:hypothetical protein